MVNIPTTERQFYNNTKKLNTFETYATTAYNSWMQTEKTMQDIQKDQEYVKIDTFQTEAQLKLNQVENDWRQKYSSDPTNVNGLKELQEQRNVILEEYGSQISPIAKQKWNSVARNLNARYTLSNQEWGLSQQKKNTKSLISRNMANSYKLMEQLGVDGDVVGAIKLANELNGRMLNSVANVMSNQEAALYMNDFQENATKSFLNGALVNNPDKVLEMLNDKEVKKNLSAKDILSYQHSALAQQKINAQNNLNNTISEAIKNPTYMNIESTKALIENDVYMSKKRKESMTSLLEQAFEHSPNYEYEQDYGDSLATIDEDIKNFTANASDDESENMENMLKTVVKIQNSQQRGKIPPEEAEERIKELMAINSSKDNREAIKALDNNVSWLDSVKKAYRDNVNKVYRDNQAKDYRKSKERSTQLNVINMAYAKARGIVLNNPTKEGIDEATQVIKDANIEAEDIYFPELTGKKAGDIFYHNGVANKIISRDGRTVYERVK